LQLSAEGPGISPLSRLAAWEGRLSGFGGEDASRLRENAEEAYYDFFALACWPDIVVAEWGR